MFYTRFWGPAVCTLKCTIWLYDRTPVDIVKTWCLPFFIITFAKLAYYYQCEPFVIADKHHAASVVYLFHCLHQQCTGMKYCEFAEIYSFLEWTWMNSMKLFPFWCNYTLFCVTKPENILLVVMCKTYCVDSILQIWSEYHRECMIAAMKDPEMKLYYYRLYFIRCSL